MNPDPNTQANPKSVQIDDTGKVKIDRVRPVLTPKHPKDMTESEKEEIITTGMSSFKYFVENIFALSFPRGFVSGQYVRDVCDFMQDYRKTVRQSPRDHFKSTGIHAYIMWRIFRNVNVDIKDFYFSYKGNLAQYHIGEVKRYMRINPWFATCQDLKPTADYIIECTWDDEHIYKLTPHGILSAARGLHGDAVFVDDPLKDPQNRMILTNILTVNVNFEEVILDIPDKLTGELHVVGTPQSPIDFFYNNELLEGYGKMMRPAIEDEVAKQALWPEWLTFDELCAIRRSRPRSFGKEYMIEPVFASETYYGKDELYEMVNPDLENLSIFKPLPDDYPYLRCERIAGHDIGKKKHPSHFVVYEKRPLLNQHGSPLRDEAGNELYKIIQLHSKWMDHWDYTNGKKDVPENCYEHDKPTQIEYIKLAQKNLRIDRTFFDNTNGVWEGFLEQGILDKQKYKPVHFTSKLKNEMATDWDKDVKSGKIEMLNDARALRQILVVTNDLQAIETEEGHGDSFWSNAMAIW